MLYTHAAKNQEIFSGWNLSNLHLLIYFSFLALVYRGQSFPNKASVYIIKNALVSHELQKQYEIDIMGLIQQHFHILVVTFPYYFSPMGSYEYSTSNSTNVACKRDALHLYVSERAFMRITNQHNYWSDNSILGYNFQRFSGGVHSQKWH